MTYFETLNSGEWSEVYAFLRALVDGKLIGTDHELNILDNECCPIVSIHKKQQQTNQELIYTLRDNNVEVQHGIGKKLIPIKTFQRMSQHLLNCIKNNSERTFNIPQLQQFLIDIYKPKIKASSYEKKDIIITVKEPCTQTNQTYGFSIKSNISKSNSTLLNASTATNFTYIVDDNIPFNNNLKTKKLLQQIQSIHYDSMDSEIFNNNLQIIDTQFPEIIAQCVLNYYQGKGTSIESLLNIIERDNPLKLSNPNTYRVKMGDFLLSIALGMMPNTPWNRRYDADGGMLVIKKNGKIATFYIFKQFLLEELKEYLITKSYFDTASTTRHNFGKLYYENGQIKVKLNLQIRLH